LPLAHFYRQFTDPQLRWAHARLAGAQGIGLRCFARWRLFIAESPGISANASASGRRCDRVHLHYLDIGGIPVLESVGLETLSDGMRQRWTDDDELLAEAEKIFDAFYQAFLGSD
jgi:hypothetical protein